MKNLIFVSVLFLPLTVLAADGEPTTYFGALWDFIDWVYEAFDQFKQTVLDYLGELGKVIFLWWLNWKLDTLIFIWSVAEPIIDSLNLTDVISTLFGGISPDVQMFITEIRLGEGLNLLLSAYLTRAILRLMGW